MDKHLHLYASVDEADIGMIGAAKQQNKTVKFTVEAYPGELFDGTIHVALFAVRYSTVSRAVISSGVLCPAKNDPPSTPTTRSI